MRAVISGVVLLFPLLAPFSVTLAHAEAVRYVSDDITTWARRGPGDNYRVSGTLKAGEAVTLLQTDNVSHYGEVRDSNGRTMWLPLSELSQQPGFRSQVPGLQQQVKSLTDKLNSIESDWNQRTAGMQKKVAESDGLISRLQKENDELKAQLEKANKLVSAVRLQLDDKQRAIIMQWFLYGGGVLGAGVIVGLLMPWLLPRKRRKDRWMN